MVRTGGVRCGAFWYGKGTSINGVPFLFYALLFNLPFLTKHKNMDNDNGMPMDSDKVNEMLIELMLQSIAETRVLRLLLFTHLSNGNEDAERAMNLSFSAEIDRQKKILTDDLFSNFGYLPPDILGQED